jgi:FAD/FMN-containing dehydrogenase
LVRAGHFDNGFVVTYNAHMTMTQHILDVQGSIQTDKRAMDRLVTLCDRYGHRLSGSDSLERELE